MDFISVRVSAVRRGRKGLAADRESGLTTLNRLVNASSVENGESGKPSRLRIWLLSTARKSVVTEGCTADAEKTSVDLIWPSCTLCAWVSVGASSTCAWLAGLFHSFLA